MVVKINTHGTQMPEQHGEWIDLFTAEEVKIAKGEFKLISLGISMQLPEGYYALLLPRSSTAKKYGIIMANSIGVIENDYCGDDDIWCFPALAFRDVTIPAGTRICQFQVARQSEPIEFEQVGHLEGQNRGGFGSTGN